MYVQLEKSLREKLGKTLLRGRTSNISPPKQVQIIRIIDYEFLLVPISAISGTVLAVGNHDE